MTPIITGAGISGLDLTRGAGATAASLTNGFSANAWDGTTSRELAIDRNAYFQFGMSINVGSTASLSTLDLSLRRSAIAAPMNFQLQASLDNFASSRIELSTFNYFGRTSGTAPAVDPLLTDPFFYMTNDLPGRPNTTTSPGDAIPTVNLSTVAALQNLAEGSQVTFRLYAWGDSATVSTNTLALGRMVGPRIAGQVSVVPEPSVCVLWQVGSVLLAAQRRRPAKL